MLKKDDRQTRISSYSTRVIENRCHHHCRFYISPMIHHVSRFHGQICQRFRRSLNCMHFRHKYRGSNLLQSSKKYAVKCFIKNTTPPSNTASSHKSHKAKCLEQQQHFLRKNATYKNGADTPKRVVVNIIARPCHRSHACSCIQKTDKQALRSQLYYYELRADKNLNQVLLYS